MRLLFAAAVLVAISVSACGDDGGPTRTPSDFTPRESASPSARATAEPSDTPTLGDEFGEFREFAASIADAIVSSDTDFFLGRAFHEKVTCRGDESFGACSGQPAGTVRHGIPGSAFWSDAFYVFTPEEYATNLNRYFDAPVESAFDAYGSGALRLFGIASELNSNGTVTVYMAITTAIVDIYPSTGYPIGSNEREAHVFLFNKMPDGWAFHSEIAAGTLVTSETWLSGACAECYDYFELWEE